MDYDKSIIATLKVCFQHEQHAKFWTEKFYGISSSMNTSTVLEGGYKQKGGQTAETYNILILGSYPVFISLFFFCIFV